MDVSETWARAHADMTKKETEALVQNEERKEKEIGNNIALTRFLFSASWVARRILPQLLTY